MSNNTYTYPTVAVLTHMTFTARRWGQFPTISFSNGAVAGSEVVTVDSSLNINVQVSSGVSTMLQVKTAIDATAGVSNNLGAGDLVSVAIAGGHNSDTVVAVKSAALAGGTALASARLTIGHLVYTAVTGGTGGNSIRVRYTSGGSLSVSVSTNDITVQLKNDGTSTNALIKAAVAASGPAAALVTCASDGLALSFVPTTAMAASFLSLAGGTAAVASSLILQDLTFASNVTGVSHNGDTITYTIGAVAGSEVVSGTSAALSVQISNGVSTATQIKAAIDATSNIAAKASGTVTIVDYSALAGVVVTVAGHALTEGVDWTAATDNNTTADSLAAAIDALAEVSAANPAAAAITVLAASVGTAGNAITIAKTGGGANITLSGATLANGRDGLVVTISGTGSNAQKTVNGAAMTGAVGPNDLSFYVDNTITALTSTFVYFPFNNVMRNFNVFNDETSGAKAVIFSFDGVNVSGQILPTENAQLFDTNASGVFMKYGSGAPAYRVFATGPR